MPDHKSTKPNELPIVTIRDLPKVAIDSGWQTQWIRGYQADMGQLSDKAEYDMMKNPMPMTFAEKSFESRERAQVTLDSIGDAVVSTDLSGCITYLNVAAENMTGWSRELATGQLLDEVLRIVDVATREVVPNPMIMAIHKNAIVTLASNCILIRRDGTEVDIEDSAAPIHDHNGKVTGAVMAFRDVSIARALTARVSHQARHDGLTGLPNRMLFSDRLTQAISLAQRRREKLAVLYLDIDRFKRVNDSFGHAIGDQLLQVATQRLLSCVRSSDTVSRQGGDEFVILLSDVTQAYGAATTAEKILAALQSPCCIEGHDVHISVSIGIATYPDDGVEAETLMKHADLSMYHAKENGRNNYQFFKAELNLRALERSALESDLHYALQRNELALHYQPQMNLQTGAIVGVEALMRWRHPQRGLIAPTQFIPIAEECGSIVSIGRWMLHEACQQAYQWQCAGLSLQRIAVNVSAVELRSRGFVAGVRDILIETKLKPGCLELELTETFLMQDAKATAVVLNDLKTLGVQLALDDFGTGYSSLSYLKSFPIDTLKIDQSFVRTLTNNADDASIVSAVISMGNSLHMRVVAEGVETQGQMEFLRKHGCNEGQGIYFSQPISASEFSQLMRSSVPAVVRHSRAHQAGTNMTIDISQASQL